MGQYRLNHNSIWA